MRTWPKLLVGIAAKLLAAAFVIYLVLLFALVVWQRRMMYFPAGAQGPASAFGLPDTQTLALATSDGQTIRAWYHPAATDRPLLLYFHGNGGTLSIRADLLRRLSADGSGFLAIDYRSYGGSTGSPSEAGLLRDGEAAYAEAGTLGYSADRIVIVGESLGTGIAVAVAGGRPIKALVLDSAYSSTADVAAAQYWMFPVRLLMKDTFNSIARIGRVSAPKLFLHEIGDPIIALRFGRTLYDAAPPPKTFIEVPGHGHMVLGKPAVLASMKAWLASLTPR